MPLLRHRKPTGMWDTAELRLLLVLGRDFSRQHESIASTDTQAVPTSSLRCIYRQEWRKTKMPRDWVNRGWYIRDCQRVEQR